MNRPPRSLPAGLVRFGFRQLYTHFAWLYDAVAHVVSLGEWQAWGRAVIPFLGPAAPQGTPLRLLELAHGPGHLHLTLRQAGYHVVGIDLSAQMSALAGRRLRRAGLANTLARASVYALPFPAGAFDAVISTFPTEFIFASQMLSEAARVLKQGGQLIVVPGAPLRGQHSAERAVQLAYRITQLNAPRNIQVLFEQSGLAFTEQYVPTRHAQVVIWLGVKRRADTSTIQ